VSEAPQLPRAARALVSFVALLRANGFAIAPEQTTAFLQAIELLGPRGPDDIRQAGLATLAPPPERRAAYDMLFRIHFLGGDEVPGAEGEDEESYGCRKRDAATRSRRSPTTPTYQAKWRCAPKRWQSAASARAGRTTRCAGSRAKPRRGCHAGAAIAACARGADLGRTFDEPCANPYATTAR